MTKPADFIAPPRRAGWIERPDARIRYEITGEGPAIIFAHGLGGNLMSWWQQVAHFAPRYTCIAFSHRGFFPSTAPAEGPDPAAYAADLAALVDELGLGDIRIICQSMGGWTGVEYALLRPGRVKALVLGAINALQCSAFTALIFWAMKLGDYGYALAPLVGVQVLTGHKAVRIEGRTLIAAHDGADVQVPFDALIVGRTAVEIGRAHV